jgi:hypothetical protein
MPSSSTYRRSGGPVSGKYLRKLYGFRDKMIRAGAQRPSQRRILSRKT